MASGGTANDVPGASNAPGSAMGGAADGVAPPRDETPLGTDPKLPVSNETPTGSAPAVSPLNPASPANPGTPPDNPQTTPNTAPPETPPEETAPPDMGPSDATLTVSFGGDGFGLVSVSASGLAERVCDDDCQITLPPGGSATFSATPRAYSVFRGWSEPACGAQPSCTTTADRGPNLRADFELGYNVAFISSESYAVGQMPAPGAAANQECARLAAAAGVHGSRWVAWLAAEGPSPAVGDDITPPQFLQNPGGWVRTDGAPLAQSRASLLAHELRNPLNLTEYGERAFRSWSATTIGGVVYRGNDGAAYDCDNWTDPSGDFGGIALASSVGSNWSGSSGQGCGATASIQCFGDDPAPQVPLPPLPAGARLAFASTQSFVPASGIGAADTLCQRNACAAGLTGSANCNANLGTQRRFLAYLHTSSQRAWDRFDLTRSTWYRVDGIQWMPEAASLAEDGATSLTGINLRADGAFVADDTVLLVGRPDGTDCCSDWSSSSSLAGFGLTEDVGFPLGGESREGYDCTAPKKVVCLEQ
jgi:hypothetical protein